MGFWPKLSGHTATNPFAEFDNESVCFVRGFWLANKVNDSDIIKIRQITEICSCIEQDRINFKSSWWRMKTTKVRNFKKFLSHKNFLRPMKSDSISSLMCCWSSLLNVKHLNSRPNTPMWQHEGKKDWKVDFLIRVKKIFPKKQQNGAR